jgi:hypothetical protein
MASRPLPNPFALAPKQLAQIINPLSWMTSGTGQMGFINISGMASSKPEVEADIIENVATYGRQLGRITDVLQAVLENMHPDRWTDSQQDAVHQFKDMVHKIAIVKAGYLAPTRENVEQLIAGINCLKETDEQEYSRIKEELRKRLFADDEKSIASQPRKSRTAASKKP